VLAPLPRSISQFEPHLVKLTLSPYIGSPYAVGRQVTTVKLPTPARIEGHGAEGDAGKHVTKEAGGAKFKWGPYPDVPAYRAGTAWIHYEISTPFATLATVTREVEVSLWGNVAVEEHYDLRHTGAALKGGFSRLDYQMKSE
jgi:oligosaccharyltransferase complex subunit alpha (ribophorin I)